MLVGAHACTRLPIEAIGPSRVPSPHSKAYQTTASPAVAGALFRRTGQSM
jgi:hypothetical protein